MQNDVANVKRLLGAIERNIDSSNIGILARLLNYYPAQLEEDIAAIQSVQIMGGYDGSYSDCQP